MVFWRLRGAVAGTGQSEVAGTLPSAGVRSLLVLVVARVVALVLILALDMALDIARDRIVIPLTGTLVSFADPGGEGFRMAGAQRREEASQEDNDKILSNHGRAFNVPIGLLSK